MRATTSPSCNAIWSRKGIRSSRRKMGERVAVGTLNASDELGTLAHSFNAMAVTLAQTEQRRQALIGDVAHELRTPLTTFAATIEGLLDGVITPDGATYARLLDETTRMRRLVNDLQDLSRTEAGQLSIELRPVPVATIIEQAVDHLRGPLAEKGLMLDVESGHGLYVRADPDRAIQIVTNLITNALRYTPAPGHLTLTSTLQNGMVAIALHDTGIGLTPEQLRHVFERFYRVDKSRARARGGSGIGLTIARALAEAMGGTLTGASPGPGRGSTFTLALPVAVAPKKTREPTLTKS